MFNNKEDAKLLSDEEFEKIGRKRKILIFIIMLCIIAAVSVIAFKIIDSDNDINVQQTTEDKMIQENAADEAANVDSEIEGGSTTVEENMDNSLIEVRNTVAKDNEFICEYSEIHLPVLLKAGDYADVRLSLADGRNYTVVSEKEIMDFNKTEEKSYVCLALCEEEILILESAINDLKLFEGSKLYLVIGRQNNKNKINYPVNENSDKLLHADKTVNNLSGYNYEVKFDKKLEKERNLLKKAAGLKGQEWKEAATYWNEKE